MTQSISSLTVLYPLLWGEGKALCQRQKEKLSPSQVRIVCAIAHSSPGPLWKEKDVFLEMEPYLGPLAVWSTVRGLEWPAMALSGTPRLPSFKLPSRDSSPSLTPHSSYSQFPSRTSQGLLCMFGDQWTSLGNWRNYKLHIYRKAQSVSSFLPYLICKMGIRALSHLLHKVLHKVEKL